MLKFATKKPPRYKHFDQVDSRAHRGDGSDACYYGDEGESYLRGDYTRFDEVNGDDMLDYDNFGEDYPRNVTSVRQPFGVYRSQSASSGYQTRSPGSASSDSNWKFQGRKNGNVGLDGDMTSPVEIPERQVGLLRNGQHYPGDQRSAEMGQRSQVNPGYVDHTLEGRRPMDLNRSVNPYGQDTGILTTAPYFTKGSGYNDLSPGGHSEMSGSGSQRPDYSIHRQYYDSNDPHYTQYHENPFPAASFSTDSNGNFGLDSTASMSIDSLSASGDRSSKSTVELQDYDLLLEIPQVTKKGMDNKPPVSQKHKHVHVGRGTHGIGVCEGSMSPTRPGYSDGHMTSSLRKSPSGVKSGHHVRWGPGVVNSDQKPTLIPISELQPPVLPKKPKKKTSLRSLLNLPRFPLSDDEGSDHGSSSGHGSVKSHATTDNRGSFRKFLDSHSGWKKISPMAMSQPITTTATELASLRYKKDLLDGEMSDSSYPSYSGRQNFPKLNVTKANEQNAFYLAYPDYDSPQHTDAISYPIVHSGMDRGSVKADIRSRTSSDVARSPVNSVRPFLINGHGHEMQDYDNFEERKKQPYILSHTAVSQNSSDINGLYQGNVSSRNLNEQKMYGLNKRHTTLPPTSVTFDTYVTHSRPADSSVTFDTFVTHGRPFATSTPVPNGNVSYPQNLSPKFPVLYSYSGDTKKGFNVRSGQASPSVTQSRNYSVGSPHDDSVPVVRDTIVSSGRVPTMQASAHPAGSARYMTSTPMTHDSHMTRNHREQRMGSGPYEMDNRVYGQLSVSPTTFMMRSPGLSPQMSPEMNTPRPVHGFTHVPQRQSELHSNKSSQFNDKCRYREQESTDYDDDVFISLGFSSGPVSPNEASSQTRRRLEYEGPTSSIRQQVSWFLSLLVDSVGFPPNEGHMNANIGANKHDFSPCY